MSAQSRSATTIPSDAAYSTVYVLVCSRPHQHRKVHWRKCSHTGTELYTDVVVQSDLDLGLTLHHQPWQEHRHLTLSTASPEAGEQGLVERQPGDRGDGKTI